MQNLDMQVHDTGFASTLSISPHHHAGTGLHEFHYFVDGHGTFDNAGVPLTVEPGTLFFSGPEDKHSAQVRHADHRFRMYWLLFTVTEDQDLLMPRVRERFREGASIRIGRGLATVFEDIRRRRASIDPLVRRSADFRFWGLLCDLVEPTSRAEHPGSIDYIDEALRRMQESLHRPLDLTALASHLGIDKSYFVRLFKRHLGVPPMRYALQLRLDSAKHRLMGGDESLRAIALDLGFYDEFHFSHQFKTHVGVSPQVFKTRGS